MLPLVSALEAAPFRLSDQPAEPEIVAKYFRGLGDPTRLRILQLLDAGGEMSVGELVDRLALPQSKVSNHLACLRWCGFAHSRREYRTVYYRLADRRVSEMIALAQALLRDNADHVAACRVIDPPSS
jgi:ArsR family transcriptional regulator, cadmium/lead-responsive transcriptional repressor